MKVTTDACMFGAWVAREIENEKLKMEKSLDIGGGTGLLSLMLAQKTNAEIDGIEIDKEAAQQAKENADASTWKKRINVINADVKTFQFEKKFDLIISNPPFYEKEIRSEKNSKNIAHHSDELKLDGLLQVIKSTLSNTGNFYLLLPYKRIDEVKKLFKDNALHINKLLMVRQSVKHDYFRIILVGKPGKEENTATELEEIAIRNEKEEYTKDFVDLLKDFYLYL